MPSEHRRRELALEVRIAGAFADGRLPLFDRFLVFALIAVEISEKRVPLNGVRRPAQLRERLATQFVVCLAAPVESLRGLTRRFGRQEVAVSQKMALRRGLDTRRGSELSGFALLGRSPILVIRLLVDRSDALAPVAAIQLGERLAEECQSAPETGAALAGFRRRAQASRGNRAPVNEPGEGFLESAS